jgi:hypothetical protein
LAARFADPGLKPRLQALGLSRPEAFWARQMASQQTAFAIAGPGPLQTDNFPLLEFEAPKAFFIGESTQVLERYDERLGKALLASAAKRDALASLSDAEIAQVFEKYFAASDGLRTHLAGHAKSGQATAAHPDVCLFRLAQWAATPVVVPAGVHSEDKAMLEAVGLLQQDATWEEAARLILGALRQRKVTPPPDSVRWVVAPFARDAAVAALARSRTDLAQEILVAAEAVETLTDELLYLRRLVEARSPGAQGQ